MNKFLKLIYIPFFLFFFCSCTNTGEKLFERSFFTMGSRLEIKLYAENENQFNKITDASIKRAEEINHLFSNYTDISVLAEVNTSAGVRAVEVPGEFIEFTRVSVEFSESTGGAFDISIGKLFELWKSKAKQNILPTDDEIKSSLECTGYEKIKIEDNMISFSSDCLTLDYGAIGKGYVVDEIIRIAKENGVKMGLVNFGGNIFALSSPPGKKYWEVGIRRPGNEKELLSTVGLRDQGVATSGDYEKFFEVSGKKYSHILNPGTGRPVSDISSVTVISDSATISDVYSTAISVMGFENYPKLENKDELGVLYITKESGEVVFKKSELFRKSELKN